MLQTFRLSQKIIKKKSTSHFASTPTLKNINYIEWAISAKHTTGQMLCLCYLYMWCKPKLASVPPFAKTVHLKLTCTSSNNAALRQWRLTVRANGGHNQPHATQSLLRIWQSLRLSRNYRHSVGADGATPVHKNPPNRAYPELVQLPLY